VIGVVAALVIIIVLLVIAGLTVAGRSIRVVQQYEKGIIYRFGRVLPEVRGPGLHVIRPIGDRMQKVNMQIVAMAVPAQDGITRDNVSVRVDAVVYFRVVDPIKATVNVQDYMFAIAQQAQTSLRSIIGQSEMDQLLAERESVNRELRRVIDEPTEAPWGIRVERVEVKDVSLPEGMKRSMSRQAEAERERRARIITADGEYQASKRLAAAANVMARDPAALQLRLLQTVVEVAGEKNSTIVMPVPVELLRFFDRGSGTGGEVGEESARTWATPRSRPPRRRSRRRTSQSSARQTSRRCQPWRPRQRSRCQTRRCQTRRCQTSRCQTRRCQGRYQRTGHRSRPVRTPRLRAPTCPTPRSPRRLASRSRGRLPRRRPAAGTGALRAAASRVRS
jgi:regulator of protease activity HflC (stomatin/prohibitin superfamily)